MNDVSDPEILKAAEALRGQPVSLSEYALAIRPKLVLYALFGTLMCMGILWTVGLECVVAGLSLQH